jgi:hypothetical protein
MSEKNPESERRPIGIIENTRDVANNLIRTQPPGFVIMLVFCFGVVGLFAWSNHDVQIERLAAVVKIFDSCTAVIQRIPLLLPPSQSKGSFNWDAATISVWQA